jgi:GMP synthase (glutamine-hydrolysing)
MTVLLLQARDVGDPMLEHELECFVERCAIERGRFRPLNLAAEPIDPDVLRDVDAVMIGGSGDYSLAKGGFDWHGDYLEFMRAVIRRDVPTFASCFGFQAIVQALGGRVVRDPDAAEVGTFPITLTDEGRGDPSFSDFDATFEAQLGHNDSVRELPDELIRLAFSARCQTQAIRVKGHDIVATQFHPELSMEDNIVRYMRYLHAYRPDLTEDEALEVASGIHRPSPAANRLLRAFVESHDL